MKLSDAAVFFDKSVARDAYNPANTFKCQLSPVALYKVDATAIRRREMSTGPGVVLPARRTITIGADVYLMGAASPDEWDGAPIRNNHVLQGADFLAGVYSLEQALGQLAPSTAWASLAFNKNVQDERQGSAYLSQYNIYFAGGEVVPANSLVNSGSRWFLIRQTYTSVSGLVVTLANEIENPAFEVADFRKATYDPVVDSSSMLVNSARVLRLRWTEWFEYLSEASEKFARGDSRLFVLKTDASVVTGDEFDLSDGRWRVVGLLDEGVAWNCHLRRA